MNSETLECVSGLATAAIPPRQPDSSRFKCFADIWKEEEKRGAERENERRRLKHTNMRQICVDCDRRKRLGKLLTFPHCITPSFLLKAAACLNIHSPPWLAFTKHWKFAKKLALHGTRSKLGQNLYSSFRPSVRPSVRLYCKTCKGHPFVRPSMPTFSVKMSRTNEGLIPCLA